MTYQLEKQTMTWEQAVKAAADAIERLIKQIQWERAEAVQKVLAGVADGYSVAVLATLVVIGADNHNRHDSGAVFIFRSNGSTPCREAKLPASDGCVFD